MIMATNKKNNNSCKNDWDEDTDIYLYVIVQEIIDSNGKYAGKPKENWSIPNKPVHAIETLR